MIQTLLALCLVGTAAFAGDLENKAIQNALSQTQSLLTDPTQRAKATAGDPSARAADANLQNLMGSSALTEQSYALAAEIMGGLVQAHGGDTAGMQKALEQASRDPAAFLQSLTPAQREKIQKMAAQIESGKPRQ